jgi:hypothetical protein
MRAPVIAVAIAIAAPSVAVAQPSLTEPSSPYDFVKPTTPEYKSPQTATALAIGASAVGIGGMILGAKMHDGGDTPIMMLGGLVAILGPSAGHWWAEQRFELTAGFGIRLIGASIAGIGFARAIDFGCKNNVCNAPLQNPQSNAMLGIGAATVAVGMIWDIATAGRAAERANARYSVSPTVVSTPTGATPGLGVTGRF